MLKLYEFSGTETDWVAASSEDEARDTMMSHYGIGPDDITGSYESISVVDPAEVEFFTDKVNVKTEETVMTTAAAMMEGKTKPFVLGSTYQ